jgi:hypothetical protein
LGCCLSLAKQLVAKQQARGLLPPAKQLFASNYFVSDNCFAKGCVASEAIAATLTM